MAIDYLQLTQTSVLQLSKLVRARRDLDAKILRLQRQLRSTAARLARKAEMAGSSDPSANMGDMGVTDAIRRVLLTYPIWLTPVSVRDLLPSVGFDAGRYKHPLTSIHSILRRLIATGEVAHIDQPPNTTRYAWAEYLPELSGINSEPVGSQVSARLCENESQKTSRLSIISTVPHRRSATV